MLKFEEKKIRHQKVKIRHTFGRMQGLRNPFTRVALA